MAKQIKTVARKSATRAVVAPTAPVASHRSPFIALAASHGVAITDDGLPLRNAFRALVKRAGSWTGAWGTHDVTPLHRFVIAKAIARMGDAATPTARKFATATFAEFGGDTFDPAQWTIDCATRTATFGAPRAARKSRRAA